MSNVLNWLRKMIPLLIGVGVAVLFSTVHFIIDSDVFEYGPLSQKGFIHMMDLKSLDLKFASRSTDDLPEPQVVIAAIDEKSIEQFGLWPWSRTVVADFITAATQGGAKVIGLDAFFADEDRNASYQDIKRFLDSYNENDLSPDSRGAKALQQRMADLDRSHAKLVAAVTAAEDKVKAQKSPDKGKVLKSLKSAQKAAKEKEKAIKDAKADLNKYYAQAKAFQSDMEHVVSSGSPDVALVKALKNSEQTVLGYVSFYNDADLEGTNTEQLERRALVIAEKVGVSDLFEEFYYPQGAVGISPIENTNMDILQIREAKAVLPPLDAFGEAAHYFGYLDIPADQDGPMRRVRTLNKYKNQLFPALSLMSAKVFFDGEIRPLNGEISPGTTLSGINLTEDITIPTDLHGRLLVNYYKDPIEYFPTYSVADFIDGSLDRSKYEGKVVLLGGTAQGTLDLRTTPFSPVTPGVYIHASAIQNIIDGKYLERWFGLQIFEILAFLLLGVLMGLTVPRVPAWAGVLVTIAFCVGLYFFDVFFVFDSGTLMLNVLPTLQAVVTFIGITVHSFLTEGREKRKIRKAFQFYLTKSVVEEVLKNPAKLQLGGEKRTCTVLFSDIRGFTTISERLTPEQLVSLLNEYLTPMTNLVFKYDGTLDKYMGDAIMAIFGAPVNYSDSATRACYCALEMMEELAVLQEGWRADGLPELDIGIGLNTGPMSVGNMGSEVRFDYTVMGDNVNLGSRLEGINKQYGTNIIISENTYAAVKDDVHTREMDSVRVKGKREPVVIYELMGKGAADGARKAIIDTFHQGIALYKAQKWDEAVATFEKVRKELKEDDFASGMYIKRCETMKTTPPGEDWDGVFTMTTK